MVMLRSSSGLSVYFNYSDALKAFKSIAKENDKGHTSSCPELTYGFLALQILSRRRPELIDDRGVGYYLLKSDKWQGERHKLEPYYVDCDIVYCVQCWYEEVVQA